MLRAAARQTGSSIVIEVNFKKGSFALNETSREALRNMVNRAKTAGTIDDLKVLAWADVNYPAESSRKISKAERNLAENRADSIRDYVKAELAVSSIDIYNMAKRPNAVQNLFDTSDATVKKAFENAGVTSAEGKSTTGRASRAVVMAMLKDGPK